MFSENFQCYCVHQIGALSHPKPPGKVLLGVKQACNKTFREQMPVEFVAVAQQHAERDLRFGENAAYSNEKLRECDGLPKN